MGIIILIDATCIDDIMNLFDSDLL